MLMHGVSHSRRQPLAFTYRFHGIKSHFGRHAHLHQLVHDIFTGAQTLGQRNNSLVNQVLGIPQPYVGTVRKTGNTDQFLHGSRLGILQHLTDKGSAELRHTVRAGVTADILRLHAQRFRGRKQAHDALVSQRDIFKVNARQFLQHMQHGGVVMTQNIQLDQNIVHGTEVIMRCDGGAFHIVSRMLHGSELVDVIFLGQDNHAGRVLSRGTLYTHTPGSQAVLFRFGNDLSPLFQILEHISVRRFFSQRSDCTGAEHVFHAEQVLYVLVSTGLIFTGEVQVDIGHLVAFEAKESFERYIKAIFNQRIPAVRAQFVRKVHADGVLRRNVKIRLAAMLAAVVNRQRIDFSNTGQECHKRRAYRTTAAYHVAILKRFTDQFLRNGVQRTVTVTDNSRQFLINTLLYDIRQFIAVVTVRRAVGQIFNILFCRRPEG